MRKSRQEIIKGLMGNDNNRICGNCSRKDGIIHQGFDSECEKFTCSHCAHQWTVGYEIILEVRVQNHDG